MKKKILLTVLSLSTLAIYGCSNKDSTPIVAQDVTPSYKGMSVTRTSTQSLMTSSVKERVDLSELVTQNAISDPTIRYYVNPGETFRLHVCLSNPSKYEIQSLTLNGKKYASYMFAEGSDLENIYIEVTAPIESGYQSYTLENMKYLDETTVKDLAIESNNTLSVGVRYTNSPIAKFDDMKISATSFSTNLQVSDKDNLIASQSLRLYISDGKEIIDQKALEIGNNSINLNTLSCSNTYQIGVLGQIDMADGRGQHYEWLAKEEFMTDDVYDFENVTCNENSVRFDLKKKYSLDSKIERIDLEIDGKVKDSISGESNYSFRNLLSDTEYTLALHYTADEKKTDKVVRTSFTSAAYKTPSISLSCQSATVDSLTLKVDKTDEDSLLSSLDLSLYDESGNAVSPTKKDDTYLFENLKSDTKYTAFLSYTYDARDGKGETKKSIQQVYSTLKNAVPEVNEVKSEIKKGSQSLTVSYELSNKEIGTIDSLTLLKDGKPIKSVNDGKAVFDSLSEDQDYSVLVDYSYDLNDGKGKKTGQKEFLYHTNPSLSISSISVVPTPKPKYTTGETIELKIGLHNAKNLTISSISVNSLPCSFVAFNSYVLASYVIPDDTYQAGKNSLFVSSINAKTGKTTYSYEYASSEENHYDFQYETSMEVEKIESSKDLDYCNLNGEIKAKLSLKNVLNQTLTSVTLSDNTTLPITKNDAGEYSVALPSNTAGLHSYQITAVNYTQNEEAGQAFYSQVIQYYVLPDQTSTSITTVEQFMAMEEGKTYTLDADLDFSNVAYTPFAFKGVLRGNNHKIKNLNFTITDAQSDGGYYGLFSSLEGFVDNLTFENAYIRCNNTLSSKHQYFGFLSGSSKNTCVRNIHVDESCIMKLEGGNGQSYMNAAGLIGRNDENIIIDDSKVSPIFWSTNKGYNVSGLVSYLRGTGIVTFRRNIIDYSYSNENATGSGSHNIYSLSSYAISQCTIDVSDLLVNIHCSKSESFSTSTINLASDCTFKVNHMIDLSTKKGISTSGTANVSIYNSFYLFCNGSTGSLVVFPSCLKEKKNALINDSYYNGETDDVKKLEDINYFFDVCGFDKDVWEFEDPHYEKVNSDYGTEYISFKVPTLNRKSEL